MPEVSAAEALLRRDRLLVSACLAIICVLSWIYLVTGAGTGMSTVAMTTWEFPPPIYRSSGGGAWSSSYWLIMLLMWWVMMIAMMVPSATPMILLYTRVLRHAQQPDPGKTILPALSFCGGYLLAWGLFSLLATALQWVFERAGLVHGMMMWSTSHTLSGLFLLAAGIYQFSPLKNRCLMLCRSPAAFLSAHWRRGPAGALRMGVEHGFYCVGCCWSLMLLLFVGGIMNLVWIAGLAIFVLLEKLLPRGDWLARASGGLMIAVGGYLLLA
jgi:predicted metal-binding membrane protein